MKKGRILVCFFFLILPMLCVPPPFSICPGAAWSIGSCMSHRGVSTHARDAIIINTSENIFPVLLRSSKLCQKNSISYITIIAIFFYYIATIYNEFQRSRENQFLMRLPIPRMTETGSVKIFLHVSPAFCGFSICLFMRVHLSYYQVTFYSMCTVYMCHFQGEHSVIFSRSI